jgi:HEPN domain-containing protein
MANVELVKNALKDAKEWLAISEKSIKMNAFSKALYFMEMALEISLKSLLIYYGIDFPKSHNILGPITKLLSADDFELSEIKNTSSQIISTYHALLDLRMSSAYSYESSFDSSFYKERANKYLKPCCVE